MWKLYLFGFTDSDHVGDLDDRSTSGYVFMMGSATVMWCSKKQPLVTLSTIEAEFVAANTYLPRIGDSRSMKSKLIYREIRFKKVSSI